MNISNRLISVSVSSDEIKIPYNKPFSINWHIYVMESVEKLQFLIWSAWCINIC
jgi:hypothetical protein